jgi:hypothetical protein
MKTNKTTLVIVVLVLLIGIGAYAFYSSNKTNDVPVATNPTPTPTPTQTPTDTSVTYTNNKYGFTFSLPADWKGYSVVQKTWNGTPQNSATAPQTGPTLLLRNPNWTSAVHYEDIPIMVFTLAQWNSYTAGNFMTSAAPFPATELGRNNTYVFALPPRWDYDYSQGYQEADAIMKTNPLHPFDL